MSDAPQTHWVNQNWSAWLTEVVEATGKSHRQLSLEAGLDASSINRMIRSGLLPKRANIPALAQALGVSKRVCYIAAGYVPSSKTQKRMLEES